MTDLIGRLLDAGDGKLAVLKQCISKGLDLNKKTTSGYTALMWASARGYLDIADILLSAGAALECKDRAGDNALIVACRNGHLGVAQSLVLKGAEPASVNHRGLTAVDIAFNEAHNDVVAWLKIQSGATPGATLQDDATVWTAQNTVRSRLALTRYGQLMCFKAADENILAFQGHVALRNCIVNFFNPIPLPIAWHGREKGSGIAKHCVASYGIHLHHKDAGRPVVPGTEAIWLSFLNAAIRDRWLSQMNFFKSQSMGRAEPSVTNTQSDRGNCIKRDRSKRSRARKISSSRQKEEQVVRMRRAQQLGELTCPSAEDKGKMLVRMLQRLAPQEEAVVNAAIQLSQIQEVVVTDVCKVTQPAKATKQVDMQLAKHIADIENTQIELAKCKAAMATASSTADSAASATLQKSKEQIHTTLDQLLTSFKEKAHVKLTLCMRRQAQKAQLEAVLVSNQLQTPTSAASGSAVAPQSATEIATLVADNNSKLTSCQQLVTAFGETQKARDRLQACLQEEQKLVKELSKPVHDSLQRSLQVIKIAATKLRLDDPQREQRHTEMLLRDMETQHDEVKLLQQQKKNAQEAIKGMSQQQDQQRVLSKKLAKARMELELLLIDEKHHEAAKVQQGIAALLAEKAQLASQMELQAQLLASPELLQNHPELRWEQAAAAGNGSSLGSARELFARDRKLADFRVILTKAAAIVKAEDSDGRMWALKRIQSNSQSIREAERLVKLHSHPLVVPLQSIFLDQGVTFLQMPFYANGDLRRWVEQIKAARQNAGTLQPLQKAAIRSTMRQLAHVLAFTHQQGITHRDVKPENVLLQDNGNIALCDFGISKDIISGAYESTLNLSAAGTLAYCAPEAGSNAWKQNPAAVDVWSYGIMLLELAAGKLFTWVAPLRQIAFQAGRLDAAVQLSRQDLPADDPWFEGVWRLISQLLDTTPEKRPSMDAVLMSDFFSSDKFALDTCNTPVDRKFRTLNSHLDALRHSSDRLPAHVVHVTSEQTLFKDMLAAFSGTAVPLTKTFVVTWGPNRARKPLQEVLDVFLKQLGNDASPAALFGRSGRQLGTSFLPATGVQIPQWEYFACGRILAKCLLEGIHVPIIFSVAVHCMLVGNDVLSSSADECISMMAAFDQAESQRLRQVLAAHHGDGQDLLMTVGIILGSADETPLTDVNKEATVCSKVRQTLIKDRRPALEAIQKGFRSLDIADHLENFSGTELATLFFGEQYVDVDRLVKAFRIEFGPNYDCVAKQWLERFVRMLSENSIRIFLARVTNRLTLPTAAQTISVMVSETLEQPKFLPEASHMQLPKCSSFESFASRMAMGLRLGEYMSRTDAQNDERLSQEELKSVIGAMGGDIRAGGYYQCICGYPYAVGECGGPMQRAPCPKCQRNIGGGQHRLEAGNRPAGLDGAQGPAWPQGPALNGLSMKVLG